MDLWSKNAKCTSRLVTLESKSVLFKNSDRPRPPRSVVLAAMTDQTPNLIKNAADLDSKKMQIKVMPDLLYITWFWENGQRFNWNDIFVAAAELSLDGCLQTGFFSRNSSVCQSIECVFVCTSNAATGSLVFWFMQQNCLTECIWPSGTRGGT